MTRLAEVRNSFMKITIKHVSQIGNGMGNFGANLFVAYVDGFETMVHLTWGQTEAEAIGNLVRNYSKQFGLEVEKTIW